MKITLILVFLFSIGVGSVDPQNFNPKPKSLKKDILKIWGDETFDLFEIEIPDSLYNNLLLDQGKIFDINSSLNNLGYVYVGRIYSCRSGGCGMNDNPTGLSSIDEDFEYFDHYIIFDDELRVKKIKVYNYQATHGHEVSGKGWLMQFIGYQGKKKLEYGKDIDSISGATISANAITYNVQESCHYLDLLRPILENNKQALKARAK